MRPPEVFVRPLALDEARRLKRRAKQARHFATRERAAILLASNVGNSVPQIAQMWMTDESHVRRVIHEFNERGMASLDPDYRGGRPRRITCEQRRQAVAVAGARPDTQGVALTRWSLPRLAEHLAELGLGDQPGASWSRAGRSWAVVSAHAHVEGQPRPRLRDQGRARARTARRAAPGRRPRDRLRSDGPAQPAPDGRRRLGATGRPERQRATYHRRHGTRYLFGAYDVHNDRLRVRLRPRRRGRENLAFMTQIRDAIPARRRIYWIQDNLSANWTPDIRAYAADHRIELVATPTYASYLNPVECHFFPITEFVVNNADYLDWDAFAFALARHVCHRNGPHRDKRIRLLEARHQIAA